MGEKEGGTGDGDEGDQAGVHGSWTADSEGLGKSTSVLINRFALFAASAVGQVRERIHLEEQASRDTNDVDSKAEVRHGE